MTRPGGPRGRRSCFFLALTAFLAGPAAAGAATIRILWDYQDLPKEAVMQVYEPGAQRPLTLWETGTEKRRDRLPVAGEIKDGTLTLSPGSKKKVVLVLENKTPSPLYFFAAPHVVTPASSSLGFKFKCLCINHVFSVMPGQVWYRVVELRVSPNFDGKDLDVRHVLIGASEETMKAFNSSSRTGPIEGHLHDD